MCMLSDYRMMKPTCPSHPGCSEDAEPVAGFLLGKSWHGCVVAIPGHCHCDAKPSPSTAGYDSPKYMYPTIRRFRRDEHGIYIHGAAYLVEVKSKLPSGAFPPNHRNVVLPGQTLFSSTSVPVDHLAMTRGVSCIREALKASPRNPALQPATLCRLCGWWQKPRTGKVCRL